MGTGSFITQMYAFAGNPIINPTSVFITAQNNFITTHQSFNINTTGMVVQFSDLAFTDGGDSIYFAICDAADPLNNQPVILTMFASGNWGLFINGSGVATGGYSLSDNVAMLLDGANLVLTINGAVQTTQGFTASIAGYSALNMSIGCNVVNGTVYIGNVEFYPMGLIGPTGSQGTSGSQGPTGSYGNSMTTLNIISGSPTLLSSNDVLLNSSSDQVRSIQSYNAQYNMVICEFRFPSIIDNGDSFSCGVGSPAGSWYHYGDFYYNSGNMEGNLYANNGVDSFGTVSIAANDIIMFQILETSVSCFQNGNKIGSTITTALHSYAFKTVATNVGAPIHIDQILLYATAPGATGATESGSTGSTVPLAVRVQRFTGPLASGLDARRCHWPSRFNGLTGSTGLAGSTGSTGATGVRVQLARPPLAVRSTGSTGAKYDW